METETVQQVIEAIRERGIVLTVNKGDKIGAPRGQLTAEEKEFVKANRMDVIAYLQNSQSAAPAPEPESPGCKRGDDCPCYVRGHAAGYPLGIQHATEELRAVQPVAEPKPARPLTSPDQAIASFLTWQKDRSGYYWWEDVCMDALRSALQLGDRIKPLYAYSCVIVHADGSEEEFERRPPRK